MCVRLSLLANVFLLWSYRCGKSKQVVLLADGRLSFWGRIEPRGVLESPIMNYCFICYLINSHIFSFNWLLCRIRERKFIIFNDNICVSGKSRAQCGQFCESTPLLAVPCNTKTDGSPLARGAFTRLSFFPWIHDWIGQIMINFFLKIRLHGLHFKRDFYVVMATVPDSLLRFRTINNDYRRLSITCFSWFLFHFLFLKLLI